MSMITPVDTASLATTGTTAAPKTNSETDGTDRFLKLLVAQMKNQDPLNPLDNAEVTSQMAQISTVNGIEKLNKNVSEMSGSFNAMQALQSVSLVGRGVFIEGDSLRFDDKGATGGGFELPSSADQVRVEILSFDDKVIDSVDLGTLQGGRHTFDWQAPKNFNTATVGGFRVVASANGATMDATELMRDTVRAVSTSGNQITLDLAGQGATPYGRIKAFN